MKPFPDGEWNDVVMAGPNDESGHADAGVLPRQIVQVRGQHLPGSGAGSVLTFARPKRIGVGGDRILLDSAIVMKHALHHHAYLRLGWNPPHEEWPQQRRREQSDEVG